MSVCWLQNSAVFCNFRKPQVVAQQEVLNIKFMFDETEEKIYTISCPLCLHDCELLFVAVSDKTVADSKLAVEEFFPSIHRLDLIFFGCRISQLFRMVSEWNERKDDDGVRRKHIKHVYKYFILFSIARSITEATIIKFCLSLFVCEACRDGELHAFRGIYGTNYVRVEFCINGGASTKREWGLSRSGFQCFR